MSNAARVWLLGLVSLSLAWRPSAAQDCAPFEELASLRPGGLPPTVGSVGYAVALSGGTAILGAPGEDTSAGFNAGAVYVFDEVPGGTPPWQETQRLVGSLSATNDQFGSVVAIDGNTMVVGCPYHDSEGVFDQGIAFVFERAAGSGVWQEVAVLQPDFGLALKQSPRFGRSVAISGDTIVVGMRLPSDSGSSLPRPGAAFVFERQQNNEWKQTGILIADDWTEAGEFSESLAVSGEIVVIGAFFSINEGGVRSGAAYVFEKDAGRPGTWKQTAKLTASDGNVGDWFGSDVAVDEQTIVVAAERDDGPTGPDAGAVYVFGRDAGGSFAEVTKLVPSNVNTNFFFGYAVDVDGSLVVVGAPGTNAVFSKSGSVYVFREDQVGSWEEFTYFGASMPAKNGGLGSDVALDETTVLGGLPGPLGGTGSALVFRIATQLLPSTVVGRNAGTNPSSYQASTAVLGQTLSLACDLAMTGHLAAWFLAFDTPTRIPLAGGQTLLCIDQGSGERFTGVGLGPVIGPTAQVSVGVPNDQALCGTTLYSQALHFGGVLPFALSNAQDIQVGSTPP